MASSLGAVGYSGKQGAQETCSRCHSGGGAPTVTIEGPTTLAANTTGDYTLRISGGPGRVGGGNVAVDIVEANLLGVQGATVSFSNEIHQAAPRAFQGGSATLPFRVQAPPFSTTLRLFASGMSSDGSGNTGGDGVSLTRLDVTVSGGSTAPRFTATPIAEPPKVTSLTTRVSALAADDGGEAALMYTWSATGPGDVTFTPNGTNAAKAALARFSAAGTYSLKVRARDGNQEQAESAALSVVVEPTHQAVGVSPPTVTVRPGGTVQFNAQPLDQFGKPMTLALTFSWLAEGGSISPTGLYTASATAPEGGGPYLIQAFANTKAGSATVRISSVADTTPPVVALTQPTEGQALSGTFLVAATATDTGGVTEVAVLVDDVQAGKTSQAPWQVEVDASKYSPGRHRIQAVAKDLAGNEGRSAVVNVNLGGMVFPQDGGIEGGGTPDAGSGGGGGGGGGGGTGGGSGGTTDGGSGATSGGGLDEGTGCGCTSSAGPLWAGWAGMALLALRLARRRRLRRLG